MLLLALDTTTAAGSVALWRDGLIEERAGDPGRSHAERLPGDLMAILGAHGLAPRDVERYAVAAGPGSFTGLRIGIATIQGLALVGDRLVHAVGTLELLAHDAARASDAGAGTTIIAWMEAYRGEVFAARYRVVQAAPHVAADGAGDRVRGAAILDVLDPPTVSAPEPLARRVGGERRRPRHRHRRWRRADAADPRARASAPRRCCASRRRWPARWRPSPRRTGTRRPARTPSCPSTCAVPTPSSPAIAPPCVRRRETAPTMSEPPLDLARAELARDLDGILAVDAATFDRPWTRAMYEWEWTHSDVARFYVARQRARRAVVAYCAGWIIFDELHINNLAVDPPWRRRGVASALLTFVLRGGRRGGRHPRDAGGPAVERAGPAPLRAVRLRLRRRPHRLLPGTGRGCARPLAERAPSTVVKPEIRRPHRPVESPGAGWYSRHKQVARRNPVSFPWTNGPARGLGQRRSGMAESLDSGLRRQLLQTDEEFRALSERHHELDTRLHQLAERSHLDDNEQVEESTLKKRKLQLKDRMEDILRRQVAAPKTASASY